MKNLEASFEANDRELARLGQELARVKADASHQTIMLEARPTLEVIIEQWEQVPRQQRRELFEAFARRIIINKQGKVKRQLIIEWRDGTKSETIFRSGRTQYTMTNAETKKMAEMILAQRPQWEILREFPELKWSGIVHRLYYYGDGIKIGKDIRVVVLDTRQNGASWAVVEELRALIKKRGVVLIAFNNEGLAGAVAKRTAEGARDAAD